jgi:hypothetical protein
MRNKISGLNPTASSTFSVGLAPGLAHQHPATTCKKGAQVCSRESESVASEAVNSFKMPDFAGESSKLWRYSATAQTDAVAGTFADSGNC